MDTHRKHKSAILSSIIRSSLFILIGILCLPPMVISADIGPKPTATFDFEWETENQPTIVEGILLQCKDAECMDSYPLEELGPQHFTCTQTACDSMAYGYARYMKLVITFSDGVIRESSVFEKNYDKSSYTVTVHAASLEVSETGGFNDLFRTESPFSLIARLIGLGFGFIILLVLLTIIIVMVLKSRTQPLTMQDVKIPCLSVWILALPAAIIGLFFAKSLPLTLLIEGTLISLFVLLKKKRWFPWLTVVTLGNLFTQTLLMTAGMVFGGGIPVLLTVVLEIVTWLLEAVLIHLTLRRESPVLGSLGISLLLNVVSFAIGLVLPV